MDPNVYSSQSVFDLFDTTRNVNCSFDFSVYNCYRCEINGQWIEENADFIGSHHQGKTNNDVTKIVLNNCKFNKFPQGLTKTFPNLDTLDIYHSKLRNITKNDLAEYKNFKHIGLVNLQLEFLPGDLFESFKNLEQVLFDDNPLKIVEPNILDGLDKLNYLSLSSKFGRFDSTKGFNINDIKVHLLDEFIKNDPETIKEFITKLQCNVQKGKKPENKDDQQQKQLEVKPVDNQNPKSVYKDLIKFIQDETTKDFQVQIDGHEFKVHKFLLVIRSPTLAEILKNNPEVENLNLVDISVEIFEKILKFLYTDELPADDETNFLHLFAAAGKLKIEELKNYAAVKSMNQIDAENSLEILNLSNKYGHDELRQKAFEEIKRNYPKINFEDEWISDGEKIGKILEYFTKMKELEDEFMKVIKM